MKPVSIPFSRILSVISRAPTFSHIWIGYSGGVDSSVLLHLLSKNRNKLNNCPITAVYVNHQLNPKAEEWGDHCKAVCTREKIEFRTVKIDAKKIAGQSQEACARELRYAALENMMGAGDLLLTGHHQDDQAETLILRLMRGSGAEGLSGMQNIRKAGPGWLVRPLLDFSRQQITEYAEFHGIKWIDDESNMDTEIDRNFVRHTVIPNLQKRWPSAVNVLSRATQHQAEIVTLIMEIAEQDYQGSCTGQPNTLNIEKLEKLSTVRIKNLVRYWLKKNGHSPANAAVLDIIINEVVHAKNDRTPLVKWKNTEIRRYRNNIYVMRPLPEVSVDADYQWNIEHPLDIDTGRLMARKVVGRGIKSELINDNILYVRHRKGGETIHPAGRKETHKLKKLFQDAGVPPWQRDRTPLLFIGNKLAAVAGHWTDETFVASQSETGWEISMTEYQPYSIQETPIQPEQAEK